MITLKFDPSAPIMLDVELEYLSTCKRKLVLDTGTYLTVINPQTAEELGYEPPQLVPTTKVYGIIGSKLVPSIRLKSILLFNEKLNSITALCIDLSPELKIDGLLGLNFLRHFKINFDFETGTLTFDRIK